MSLHCENRVLGVWALLSGRCNGSCLTLHTGCNVYHSCRPPGTYVACGFIREYRWKRCILCVFCVQIALFLRWNPQKLHQKRVKTSPKWARFSQKRAIFVLMYLNLKISATLFYCLIHLYRGDWRKACGRWQIFKTSHARAYAREGCVRVRVRVPMPCGFGRSCVPTHYTDDFRADT